MDIPAFEKKVTEVYPPLAPDLVVKEYGAYGDARKLFEGMKSAGLIFLDEGTHRFTLDNGALLTVYASPWTPALGAWGFQYRPERGHDFSIEAGVNVAVTHGPPKGVMDYSTPTAEREPDVPISSRLLLARDRNCTALGISTKVGARNWLPGDTNLARIRPISLISRTRDLLWWRY